MSPRSLKPFQPAFGHGLAQYGLVVGLVSVVAIGSLAAMGGWTDRLFRGTIRTGQTPPAQSAPTQVAVTPGSQLMIPPAQTGLGPIRTYTITLSNGRTLTVPLVDPEAAAESAGANGVTRNSLAALDNIIAQLERMPQDNPQLLPALRELARRGHDIEAAQALIADHVRSQHFEDFSALQTSMQQTTVNFQGRPVTLLALDQMLSMRVHSFIPLAVTSDGQRTSETINNFLTPVLNGAPASDVANPELTGLLYNFLDQYHTLYQSGLLEDPVLKQLVGDQLTRQIAVSSVSTTRAGDYENVKKLVQLTHAGAKGICDLSNASDCAN